jgi:hypothetical protein
MFAAYFGFKISVPTNTLLAHVVVVDVDDVTRCLSTAATNRPIVNLRGDT